MKEGLQEINLYSFATSPYGAKVEAYLNYKALNYSTIHINPLKIKEELPLGQSVPVLEIDGEFKNESSQIGIWLDEKFTESKKLVNSANQKEILETDKWVSENLIPLVFYSTYPQFNLNLAENCWSCMNLAKHINQNTKLGLLRFLWPVFIKQAPFIKRLIKRFEGESFQEAKVRVFGRV